MTAATSGASRSIRARVGLGKGGAHSVTRYAYRCYRKRTAGNCDARLVPQERVESELSDVLRTIALPDRLVAAFDAALAQQLRDEAAPRRRASAKSIETRLERVKDLYVLGDFTHEEYMRRRDDLRAELESSRGAKPRPTLARQREVLRTLVHDWDVMTVAERRRVLAHVFEELQADGATGLRLRPRDVWLDYMRAVVGERGIPVRCLTERKTGLYVPNVETTRLVRDERGWLRLTG